jgi:hypothetical protein
MFLVCVVLLSKFRKLDEWNTYYNLPILPCIIMTENIGSLVVDRQAV